MAREWTEGQKHAIYDDFAGNALVSASAGSGKTSVLTERVMDKITGTEQRPEINVDQLLIVTFTNAAAKKCGTELEPNYAKKLMMLTLMKRSITF